MSKELVALAVAGLKEIAEEFASEIGRKPSASELMEILTWGFKSLTSDPLSDVRPSDVIAIKVEVKKRSQHSDSASAVSDLNDNAFVLASDFILKITGDFEKAEGRCPKLAEFCQWLQDALRSGNVPLADLDPAVKVKAEVRKKKTITCKVGDLVAIPARNRKYFIAVVLAKNQFGVAYGFFKGTSSTRPISINSHPPVDPHPVYSGEELVESGRWKIFGHDEALLSLFPSEPEIYHYQLKDKPKPRIGPYGSAETPSGRLRHLTEKEAEEVGLFSGEYRSSVLPDLLEKKLNRTL